MIDTDDERYAQGADFLLQKTRQMSAIILALSAGYGVLACVLTEILEAGGMPLLIVTATAVMNMWVNRRVIVEIPKYRSMLADVRLARSRYKLVSIIAIDALSLLASLCAAVWLFLRLTGLTTA